MKEIKKIFLCIGFLTVIISAQQMTEVTGWKMQDSSKASATTGEAISASTFDASSWYVATVPGTVLSTLVDRGVYSDPYMGTYMTTIPDLAKEQRRYWFRSTFTVKPTANQRVWLDIEGINYQAYIFINGKSVGVMLGAFKGEKYDITDNLDPSGNNCLAVKIRGPYTPGSYHTKENGACGNNGGVMTGDGPTFIASQSWDWIPTIPDRDMGIWKPVYIRVTGPVALRTPWIKTTGVSAASATVPLQVTLLNSTALAVSGTAKANIDGTTQFTPKTVSIPANGSVTVSFDNLTMTNPKLWWPNGYGDPNLYSCNISFTPDGGTVSDSNSFKFGVREWGYTMVSSNLVLSCNGKRILCRGGNWGMDDAMKRWDLHKLENKIRYHKEMNFNTIRDWLGMTDNEPFYQFCDKYGMIVWSDFWQPYGPGDGPEPTDINLFEANELDKILRARNHASIAIWCARNETAPNQTLLKYLQDTHTKYDGTRRVQPSSGSDGAHSGGPYTWTNVASVNTYITGFHTEFGAPTVPSFESMATFVPSNKQAMPMGNDVWYFHDYCEGNGHPVNYTTAMSTIWGAPSTLQDCCIRAQLMNYDEYRATFESLQSKRFNDVSGVLLWMSNCVWPSLMWQTYDYYMEGTGAFYGCQKGAEQVHIMRYNNTNIQVINNSQSDISNFSVSAATYNLDGTKAWSNSQTGVTVASDNLKNIFGITAGTSTPYFVDMKLKNTAGEVVSKNFYWLPADGSNTKNMLSMAKTTVVATANAVTTKSGSENTITLKVVNTGTVCAIACRLLLTHGSSGARVLPVHYNDNYFSLIPGDTQNVIIKYDDVDAAGEAPKLTLSGINVNQITTAIAGIGATPRSVAADRKVALSATTNGSKMKLHNVAIGSAWQLSLVNMEGRSVLSAHGTGNGNALTVSTAHLRSGMYVATLCSAGETLRTMVTVADHGMTR